MTKITKFPSALISGDCTTSSLRLDGGSTASYWYGDLQYLKATH